MELFPLPELKNVLRAQQASQLNRDLRIVLHVQPVKVVLLVVPAQFALQTISQLPVVLAHLALQVKQVPLVENVTLVLKVKPLFQEVVALLALLESLLVQVVYAAIAKQEKPRLPDNAQSVQQATRRLQVETALHGLCLH